MKTVLVTGGAGFIGSNLVGALHAAGVAVRVLDDLSTGYSVNLEHISNVDLIEGSVTDATAVGNAVRGCDVVFHLAASVGNKRSIDDPLFDATTNVLGTLTVLEAAREHGVRKVVYSSSAGIFGELKTLPITEDHPLDPDSPYGVSKLAGEKAVLAYAKLYELEGVALRYFNVYGSHQRFDQYGNVIPIFVFQMLAGDPITVFGDGEQTRDFVNVADVVQANVKAALAQGVSGAFNIASGTRISINDLVARLAELIGGDVEIGYGEPRPGDVLHSLADVSAARGVLGFDPEVDITEGLAGYVAWARDEVSRSR